jgi:hypothetical protein
MSDVRKIYIASSIMITAGIGIFNESICGALISAGSCGMAGALILVLYRIS